MQKSAKTKLFFRVAVKRSRAGLGLYASEDIPKGRRIIEYKGEIISNDEADRRGGMYLFEVNSRKTIDGSSRSNTARYINHSCRPNCEPVWWRKGMWIKARRVIKAGEELHYNYGKDFFDVFIKPLGCKCAKCSK